MHMHTLGERFFFIIFGNGMFSLANRDKRQGGKRKYSFDGFILTTTTSRRQIAPTASPQREIGSQLVDLNCTKWQFAVVFLHSLG